MQERVSSTNPRLELLRRKAEQTVLTLLRLHDWSAEITREVDGDDCIEIAARRGAVSTRIAVLYTTAISNASYRRLSNEVDRIFFTGQPYRLDSYAVGVTVPVEPLNDFFPFLVELNRQVEPDRSPPVLPLRPPTVRRLTSENPLDAVMARLRQFTSRTLARRLVEKRSQAEAVALTREAVDAKAVGIAYSMRGALDYIVSTPREALNRRALDLYYGTMALAQAEMLASPSGPVDLDAVEGMTQYGHGLYALPMPRGGFADLRVGVLASGFFPQWMKFLGHDTSTYPKRRPKSPADLKKVPPGMVCSLRDLYACMPEIDDLFVEVFDGPPGWVSIAYDRKANQGEVVLEPTAKKAGSTYGLFLDASGEVSIESLKSAGWPLAEIRRAENPEGAGTAFRARVDHAGHDLWWRVLPTHRSPFREDPVLLFPPVGGLQDYRTIAAATLYALSWRAICRAHGDVSKEETKISISLSSKPHWRSGNASFPSTSSRASREKPCALRNPVPCSDEGGRPTEHPSLNGAPPSAQSRVVCGRGRNPTFSSRVTVLRLQDARTFWPCSSQLALRSGRTGSASPA